MMQEFVGQNYTGTACISYHCGGFRNMSPGNKFYAGKELVKELAALPAVKKFTGKIEIGFHCGDINHISVIDHKRQRRAME